MNSDGNPFETISRNFDELKQGLNRVVELLEGFTVGTKTDEVGQIELAAEVTGLSKSSIYHLTHEGKIPCSKRGKRLYFKRSELETWLMEKPIPVRKDLRQIPVVMPRRKRRGI
jgi:excisionase family DNA binding protein